MSNQEATVKPTLEVEIPARVLVHKTDHEGTIELHGTRGILLTAIEDRPDWSEGLVYALLNERQEFYASRLGPAFTMEMRFPTAINFDDLGWVGIDENGSEMETPASDDFRMEFMSAALGVDREEGTVSGALAEAELEASVPEYSRGDLKLVDEALRETMGQPSQQTQDQRASGTTGG